MQPGDRVELGWDLPDLASRAGTVTRIQNFGWGDKYVHVWVWLDGASEDAPYAQEHVRLIEGENA